MSDFFTWQKFLSPLNTFIVLRKKCKRNYIGAQNTYKSQKVNVIEIKLHKRRTKQKGKFSYPNNILHYYFHYLHFY